MESRSQRPPRLCERPPGGGTAPVEELDDDSLLVHWLWVVKKEEA